MAYTEISITPPSRKWLPKHSAISIAASIIVVLLFYGLMSLAPIPTLAPFFLERGIIQPVILSGAITIMIYCALRNMRIQHELRSLKKNWLLDSGDYKIDPGRSLRESIGLLSQSKSISANRQQRILAFFANSKSRQVTRDLSKDDASSTHSDIDDSYALVRVTIWAMPMLGFLGTVIGISLSISGFSGLLSGVSDIDAVKTGLTRVTTGLSTAFDTTLLGILSALVCTFASSICERNEQRLAQGIEEVINDNLLPRLT